MRGQVTEVLKVYGMQERQLVIPVYQRNYDWGQKQCQQLLDDLVNVTRENRPKHFFGAVVGQPEGSWKWVVIDGQQRLTTVSLLMLALADLLDREIITSGDPGLSDRIRSSFLLLNERDDTPRFKLKPVKNDAKAYGSLFGPQSQHITTSSVTANFRFFEEEIPKLEISADELWAAIERLEVMHLDLEAHDDAQRIFESLNSTGLALSEADKIRNLVLMGLELHEQEKVYENYWNAIELNVSYDTGTFLRWFLITMTPRTPRRDAVYEAFKAYAAEQGTNGAELLEEVRTYSEYYKQIRTASTGNTQIDFRLRRINQLNTDVVLPLLMSLLDDFNFERITTDDLARCLRIVESYIFRRYASRFPTNALNKIFATIHREISRLRPPNRPLSDILAYSLQRRTGSGWFPDNEYFSQSFISGDLYHFHGDRRKYLFECLENLNSNDTRDIANGLESGVFSVEHIMPQSLTDSWRQMLGPDAEEIHSKWLHRIGNLTVTGYNSSYSNASYEKKRTMPDGFERSPFRLNQEMRKFDIWGEEQLKIRSERLVKDALEYWMWPETDFEPPRPQLSTEPLGVDTEFKGRDAVGFTWNEHHATVRNWRELTMKVFSIALTERREEFIHFAQSIDWFKLGDQYNSSDRSMHRIGDGVGWNANSNTETKVSLMRRLLTHLDLDPEELVFTLRPLEDGEDRVISDGSPTDQDDPYAEITKFIPPLGELVGSPADDDYVSQIVTEFADAFQPFLDKEPVKTLGSPVAEYLSKNPHLENASSREILALISAKFMERDLLNHLAINELVADGSLYSWLCRLQLSQS